MSTNWSLERILFLMAGTMTGLSALLSALVSPWFLLLTGFVARRKQGTSSIYRIADPAVLELCDRVCARIESQLAELGAVLSR